MINDEEFKKLTQSKFWKPEIGNEYRVVLTNWRYDDRSFKDGEEKRPTFVADVISANDETFLPHKEFSTSSMMLRTALAKIALEAQEGGKKTIEVGIVRYDKKNYGVVKFSIVRAAIESIHERQSARSLLDGE
jgi:hypothetical protein